ncbi:GDYXXLXY domain-containing protein [Tepidibacter aestuarii]|uniref:GDYXXLXY domain-containing protein n=1 Tax=Tepidibacter aestuarii TaxID=2925782 RepID=UPI0020BD9E7E|nr:GDYXXLXY domain-containing protein [Tepidibacter aestuarii]CAH2215263.1 conserved protein of unknown function [Tepidibacter aestuarii]
MKNNKYIISMILPIIILIGMTITPLMTYCKGDEIIINTKPYDPRDFFRGDYVYLNYDINDISLDQIPDGLIAKDSYYQEKLEDKKLYVVLKKEGGIHKVDYLTDKKPKNKIYLKAKYNHTITDWEEKKENEKENIIGIRVSYNLDKYFVEENTGANLEDKSREGTLKAKVKVYNGYSLLIDVF